MYRTRPTDERSQRVFDYTLRTRLDRLGEADAVVMICDSETTVRSLDVFRQEYPQLLMVGYVTNPAPYTGQQGDTPARLGWEQATTWQRMAMTDRWARISAALTVGAGITGGGYLLMPAHDAVWGEGLLERLAQISRRYGRDGMGAAISPYTYHQHSAVPGAAIPTGVIDLLNTAFSRDTLFPLRIRWDRVQAFWGKMSLTPVELCQTILKATDKILWEDDLEIDSALRASGKAARCVWVQDARLYRQALPVFDREGVRTVIERTLHYSLNIPGEAVGGSTLNFPLDWVGQVRRVVSRRFRQYNAEAEAMIGECAAAIRERLERYGASWVDWGAYRYVVRVGDPTVEIWRRI